MAANSRTAAGDSVDAGDGRAPLTDRVAQELVTAIRDRGLREGDPIPSTGELAEQFNVSRTVVREALAELAGRGLLKRQQGREGTFTVPGGEHLAQLLRYRMTFDEISHEDLQEFREVLEVAVARLAAGKATGSDIARLSDALAAMRRAGDEDAMLTADVEFHRMLASASGNRLFELVLDALAPLLAESRRAVWTDYVSQGGRLDAAVARHTAIRDSVADRDPEQAARAMSDDLRDTREVLEKARPRRSAR